MKRLHFIFSIFVIFILSLSASTAFSQNKRLTTAQMKETCKTRVVKAENGDVYFEIKRAPENIRKEGSQINSSILDWLAYYDPNYDYAKLNKLTVREAGEGGSPRSMGAMLEAIVDFMATNNVKLRAVQFSPNNVRNSIENGLPYLISILLSPDLDKIKNRSEERKNITDMKSWIKSLRDSEIKKFSEGKYSQYAQITGFNKKTGEFQISIGSRAKYWLTDKELKAIATRILEPRL